VEGEFQLGRWTVAPRLNSLSSNGKTVHLEPKVMQVLVCLAEAGDVVSKERLMRKVWTDTFVTDDVLIRSISELRKAFEDDPRNPQYIQTIPKSGYRLIAAVEGIANGKQTEVSSKAEAIPPAAPAQKRPALWTGLALGLIAILAAAYVIGTHFGSPARSPAGRDILAVLPFQNLSNDPKDDYFADGLTAEMISQLGRLPSERLGVINWASTIRYKGVKKSDDEIGWALGANYLLEGTVRRAGERVRITAELVRIGDRGHLWANSYDGDLGDILALQSRVAREIASEIRLRLTPEQDARLANPSPINPEGYVVYLKGRFEGMGNTETALRTRIEKLEQSIQLNPNYAPAYAGLGECYRQLASLGYAPSRETYAKARAALLKGLQIDPNFAETHHELAWMEWRLDWNFAAAEKEFQRSIQLNPNDGLAREEYSLFLKSMGRYDEALEQISHALEMNPLSSFTRANAGSLLALKGSYDEATAQFRKAIDAEPAQPYLYMRMGAAYLWQGKTEEGTAQLEKARDLSNNQPEKLLWLGYAYAISGRKAEAAELLNQVMRASTQQYVAPSEVAMVYAGLGDKENAIRWLERAYEQRDEWLVYLRVYPEFKSLHSERRFLDLERRIGLIQ
jgi:TolB-like protein/DNA-binding winged helix-turn-helix (wHTH) protein/Tfp pilus assembly protein PilF